VPRLVDDQAVEQRRNTKSHRSFSNCKDEQLNPKLVKPRNQVAGRKTKNDLIKV